jgi:hypothetical protein
MSTEQRRITLTQEDGWWIAHDDEYELTAEDETREGALESLDAVVEAVEDDGGQPPTDDELREAGIDPEENHRRSEGEGDLPNALE